MDDIFSILIYLFIIISFLSSIFKKKDKNKEEHKTPPPSYNQQTVDTSNRSEVPAGATGQETTEDYSILKEIEDMFKDFGDETKTDTKIPQRDASEEETRMEKSSGKTSLEEKGHYSREWHKPVESEHKRTESEHSRTKGEYTLTTDWEREKEKAKLKAEKIDSKVEEQAKKMEKLLERSSASGSSYATDIKRKLKNPRSIKEYIIVSEIIGKPKAFTE